MNPLLGRLSRLVGFLPAGRAVALVVVLVAWVAAVRAAEPAIDVDALVVQARSYAREGDLDAALRLANIAAAAAPTQGRIFDLRAQIYGARGEHAQALADWNRALEIVTDDPALYDKRGSTLFKLGQIDKSLADFDRYLALAPSEAPHHWRRGISLYYAGRYREGREQFEAYQSVDAQDVENVVWRFLCQAREQSLDAARAALLPVDGDRRVPMKTIHALFAGKATPEDVLRAADEGAPDPEQLRVRQFYAHLYVGLYCEAAGDAEGAKRHLRKAARELYVPHYMGDVARVHAQRLGV